MGKIQMSFGEVKIDIELPDEEVARIYREISDLLLPKVSESIEDKKKKIKVEQPVEPLGSEIEKLPSGREVYDYIKSQPNYRHSMHDILLHFIGKIPKNMRKNPEERAIYDRMWARVRRARERIAKEKEGVWRSEPKEGTTVYWFEAVGEDE